MIRTYLLVFILCFMSSCKSQEYNHGVFDLNTLDFKLNAQHFYAESMNRAHIKMEDDQQFVEKDTLSGPDLNPESDPQKITVFQYNVKKYADEGSVAVFNDVYFFSMSAMTDEKDNLMMVNALSNCSADKYTTLIQKLNKEFGKPEISGQSTGLIKNNVLTWILADRMIQLVSDYKFNFQAGGVMLTDKEKELIREAGEDRLNKTHLFICSLKAVKQLRGQLHSGSWSDFN